MANGYKYLYRVLSKKQFFFTFLFGFIFFCHIFAFLKDEATQFVD